MSVSKWCCEFENSGGVQGCGVIVQFTGVEFSEELSHNLLGLNKPEKGQKKEKKLETLWAILTCHRVISGHCVSGSDDQLKGWKICVHIDKKKQKLDLSSQVSDVISCCDSRSVLGPGITVINCPHPGGPCTIDLDFTVLFCTSAFKDYFKDLDVAPPSISVSPSEQQLCTVIKETHKSEKTSLFVARFGNIVNYQEVELKTTCPELKPQPRLEDEMAHYRRLQRLQYSFCSSTNLSPGSPIVYINPESQKEEIIGIHVEDRIPVKGGNVTCNTGNTIYGLLHLLAGGPVSVFGVLQNLTARQLWANRWNYLLFPYLRTDVTIKIVRLLDILVILTKKTENMGRLVSLSPVDPREARIGSIELLIDLFRHFSAYNAEEIQKVLEKDPSYEESVKRGLGHILWGIKSTLTAVSYAKEPDNEKDSTIEKYFHCYDMIMNFKHDVVEKHMLSAPVRKQTEDMEATTIELLESVAEIFKFSDSIQRHLKSIKDKSEKMSQDVFVQNTKVMLTNSDPNNSRDKQRNTHPFSDSALEEHKLQHSDEKLVTELQSKIERLNVIVENLEAENANLRSAQLPMQTGVLVAKDNHDLPGVEVCAVTTVNVTNSSQGQTFHWEGYGLTLHFPAQCLPQGLEKCTITIMASIAGQYEFPKYCHLVSGVYWLRCEPSCKFTKDISLEIEHCAQQENASQLRFVRSFCTQKNLPYEFMELGGTFSESSSYGIKELSGFSGVCITRQGPGALHYSASVFYLEKKTMNPKVHFVVTWNTELHLTVVKQKYADLKKAEEGPQIAISFESERIILDIPVEGVTSKDGEWEIIPLTSTQVTKDQVDTFKPGSVIPSCHLDIIASEHSTLRLKHKVDIIGAKEPNNLFTIVIPAFSQLERKYSIAEASGPTPPKLRDLISDLPPIANQWKRIGTLLEIESGVLDTVAANHNCDVQACLQDMLDAWLKRVNPPPTWNAIIDAIEKSGNQTLARDLRLKYKLDKQA